MDLTTEYLGLQLEHPVIASAGPLTQSVSQIQALAEGGAAAIVLHSLFEEQVRHEEMRDVMLEDIHADSFAESLSYFPTVPSRSSGPTTAYLRLLERAVERVDVPIIASINGSTLGGWTDVARQFQEAGAAAVELNIYLVPENVHTTGAEVEQAHLDIVSGVCEAVSVPVTVKMSPFLSAVGNMASRLVEAGASGLVLFNRFLQPDVDLETLSTRAGVSLSQQAEGRIARSWIAALRGRVSASLCGSSGVENSDDVVRYLLAGADVVGTTSALVRHGVGHLQELTRGLAGWMDRKGFDSPDEIRGRLRVPDEADADSYGRQGYVSALEQAKDTFGAWAPPVR